MSTRAAFERLHPSVQRRLWDMQWTELREIQTKAIHHLLDLRGDCIISAPTAGGKTEAAFLPILSLSADDNQNGVRAMYVGPLKALINDQFRRIEALCARMEMPVHRWHGDVGEGDRKKLLTKPSGVLLITPESLEAMFVLRPTKMPYIFGQLAFLVIDELHAFIGTERGAQLQSLIARLTTRTKCDPVRIGLSATLGNPQFASRWLRPGGEPAALLEDTTSTRELMIRVRGFWEDSRDPALDRENGSQEHQSSSAFSTMARSILMAIHGSTNLVFANAKAVIESLADTMKQEAVQLGVKDELVVHHGSLSKTVREYAEARLSSGAPVTAVCSNTLELGIDVGRIDTVVQLASPPSVSSLVQRMGRSGRTDTAPAKLRAFFLQQRPDSNTSTWGRLHLDLIRGLASIELMLKGFVEPVDTSRSHYSTLVQQVLSILAETGGTSAAGLFMTIRGSGAFEPLDLNTFANILRALGRHGLIEQMSEGDLILAPGGQKLVEHYSFYAAFKTPEEVAVFHGSEKIGSLPSDAIPGVGEHLILAGRRWRVVQFDATRREVIVETARGRRPPIFRSALADTHPTVHEQMRLLLLGNEVPEHLDEVATEILSDARAQTRQLREFVPQVQSGGTGTLLFLWAGKRITRTVHLALRIRNLEAYDLDVGIDVAASPSEAMDRLVQFADSPNEAMGLAEFAESELGARVLEGQKYDDYLPDDVWRAAYGRERLDVEGALRVARQTIGSL